MPMSPRLLRPAQSVHPEAADWARRVASNGASVSPATLRAVSAFCKSITANNLRDRFYRLNLFCGTGLNACLVPLFRGPSQSGTQYGLTADQSLGSPSFGSPDYVERGVGGGLIGNGSSKYLNTGMAHNTLPQNDSHIASYETARASATFRVSIGARASNTTGNLILGTWSSTANYSALAFESASVLNIANNGAGFYVCSVNGASDTSSYRNGGSKVTSTSTTRTPGSQNIFVFALNDAGSVNVPTDARLAGYSVGLKMTDAQVASYNTAMQVFQTALGRNV